MKPPSSPILQSDKAYWHKYLGFYERLFAGREPPRRILEFGVLRGDSIRWLASRFPDAHITGADILARGSDWPEADNIEYIRIDQGSREDVRAFFQSAESDYDLIIDDGSHIPEHQVICLTEGLPKLTSGGLYILEDIHTSHPMHPVWRKGTRIFARPEAGPLHVLLAFHHRLSTGAALDKDFVISIESARFFSQDALLDLASRVKAVEIYKRSVLPDRCFHCGKSDFDYSRLKCRCGVDLYHCSDSMSAALRT